MDIQALTTLLQSPLATILASAPPVTLASERATISGLSSSLVEAGNCPPVEAEIIATVNFIADRKNTSVLPPVVRARLDLVHLADALMNTVAWARKSLDAVGKVNDALASRSLRPPERDRTAIPPTEGAAKENRRRTARNTLMKRCNDAALKLLETHKDFVEDDSPILDEEVAHLSECLMDAALEAEDRHFSIFEARSAATRLLIDQALQWFSISMHYSLPKSPGDWAAWARSSLASILLLALDLGLARRDVTPYRDPFLASLRAGELVQRVTFKD